MAKFQSYYILCPLIDQNSFLGVTEDKESENVVVTLSRNVVNKYRLSDQKQIGGWTSKDHITAPVIYDKEQESYIGVFNKNTIKSWKNDDDNLDKLKKYKFSINILKLVARTNDTALIIFENGNCASLPYGVDNRKTYENKLLIKESETIIDVACCSIDKKEYVCYVLKNKKDAYEILTCPIREELGDLEKAKLNRIKVTRSEDVYVVGHLICTHSKNIYILWSDSKMGIYDIKEKSWKVTFSIPWISTVSEVSVAWMGDNNLIFFGSNTEQDGAILVAYNVALGVGSCKYPMKMYTQHAKLYCFNSRILLQASNHIGMLPYILETDRNLSSLLGSHDAQENQTVIADWGTSDQPLFRISNEMQELLLKGLSERSIFAQIIPSVVKTNDFNHILKALLEFQDIPESNLVMLLNYTIKEMNVDHIDITNEDEFLNFCSSQLDYSEDKYELIPKFVLLNHLLRTSFSDALMLPHLQNGMSLDNGLFLLSYIAYLITETDLYIAHESIMYDWCTLLLDAFYQQYLMIKDEKVSYVLEKVRKIVVGLIDNLNNVSSVMPELDKIINKSQVPEEKVLSTYTIELLNI
ncbi:nucleolar protein 11 [Zerene cesonia]|uniref:nucleolar protein 11 n=1 Tax=Zerene cesonia TaxID=33412 RepID=UPI0018E5934F|nr:nucleolar protein 11 [Zerene cesonia]